MKITLVDEVLKKKWLKIRMQKNEKIQHTEAFLTYVVIRV